MRSKGRRVQLTSADLHPHLEARMHQRGITLDEIEGALNEGWDAADAKPGTSGKVRVFSFGAEWEGQFYQEKEVTVYHKKTDAGFSLLTAKARYGEDFPRG